MAQKANFIYIQRSPNGTDPWTTLQSRSLTDGGVFNDTCFDQPPAGVWYYRIVVTDSNGNNVGLTSLLGMSLSR